MIVTLMPFTQASVEESCCFCVADTSDKTTTSECERWLKDNGKSLSCTKKQIIPSHDNVVFEKDLSCRKVSAYGANHGLSYFYFTVFQFASKAARALNPVELSYDGSTCLVFNNTQTIEQESRKLSQQFPGINFTLAGNQNEGVVKYINFLGVGFKPKEIRQMSSKMTVHAQGGLIEVEYGECSRPQGKCGFARQDMGAKTDSNEKFCMNGNEVVSQKCCEPKKGSFGRWSLPGMECEG